MKQEAVREILSEAIDVTKEVPAELRSIAFTKVFDFLTGCEVKEGEDSSASRSTETAGSHEYEKKVALGKVARRSRNGIGPKESIAKAVEAGFFDEPRTIEALAQHFKQDFVLTFESKLLATTLGRLVREGLLRRSLNEEGRYEYRKL